MEELNYLFSWKKDKYDSRDYLHKMTAISLPSKVNLSTYCPPVRDQGRIGSCTGFGIGGILGGIAKQKKVFKEWFSPTWIYNGARYIDGSLLQDCGAEPGDCFSWLRKNGSLLESYWKYNPSELDTTTPPSALNTYASQYPLLTYIRVTNGSSGICSALAANNFVTIGTPWFYSWMQVPSSGVLPAVDKNSRVVGGHMTYLYGYDAKLKVFYGVNSWGTSWGNKGYFTMPFSAFDSLFKLKGGYDAYYVTIDKWPVVSPAPVVTPVTKKMIRIQLSTDNGSSWNTIYTSESL
jgi:hypothetical protein